jgi:hypothetical protein
VGIIPGLSDTVSLPESGSGSIGLITLDAKRAGKPYEGKPHVRFDEKVLEIGYGRDSVTLSEETGRNGEHKHRPVATTPVLYSTFNIAKEDDGKGWFLDLRTAFLTLKSSF